MAGQHLPAGCGAWESPDLTTREEGDYSVPAGWCKILATVRQQEDGTLGIWLRCYRQKNAVSHGAGERGADWEENHLVPDGSGGYTRKDTGGFMLETCVPSETYAQIPSEYVSALNDALREYVKELDQ